MAYSAKVDIQKEISDDDLIGLTDDESAGIINDVRLTAAIAKADAIIDSYCGQVATVPFVIIPEIIKQHSVTIAIYFLYVRRGVAPDLIRKNYEDAVAHLKDIATSKASLPPVGEAGDSIDANRDADDKIFSMGKKSDGSSGTLDNY